MMDADKGFFSRPRQGLREGEPHEQGTHQPRRKGGGDAVKGVQGDSRLFQGFPRDGDDGFDMFPCRQLGDHPAEGRVIADLGPDDTREDSIFRVVDGGGGLVARGLNP